MSSHTLNVMQSQPGLLLVVRLELLWVVMTEAMTLATKISQPQI
jgi:hypothetical protein